MKKYAAPPKAVLFFLLCLLSATTKAQDSIRLLFIGDVMQHMPQIEAAKSGERYSYADCFRYINPVLSNADITVANLETTLAGKPYSGYPMFCAPDELASELKRAGVDLLSTVNNHSCDKGLKGIVRTLDVLDSLSIPRVGTYRNSEEKSSNYPYITQVNGFKLAFLSYTYGTNGMMIPEPTVVNLINRLEIAFDVQAAKQQHPDAIIAILHWGEEYMHNPAKQQLELADFLIEQGVTLVIGSHPHVVQPMEHVYAADGICSGAIVYSLGNFVSNQQANGTDGGAIAHITLKKEWGRVQVANASYSLVWVYKPVEEQKKKYYILPAHEFEYDKSFFQQGHYERFIQFINTTHNFFESKNKGFSKHIF